MAGTSRRVDFLHLHANVSRRVRNLETGVHPTLAESADDTAGPTDIIITGPFGDYSGGVSPQWQRRAGVVTLLGGVTPAGGWSARDDQETVGTLPAGARPLAEMMINGPMRTAPYVALVRITTDGVLSVFNPHASENDDEGVRFDGIIYTID